VTARLPPPAETALLLDVDGTLLDIAPAPDLVVVPPSLPDALRALRARLGGALALISGRPVEQVEALFPDVAQAIAGEHGGALRLTPGGPLLRPDLPSAPADWVAAAERLVAAHPGALLERKARGFVLHYRQAPEAGPALGAALRALVADASAFAVQPAHMAWELRPAGADKGRAVTEVMRAPPFAGRRPVFVGDDVTDRDAIAAAEALGGVGLWVPDAFGGPAGVRAWLAQLAQQGW
jgi:trehalose 6-phosphate phosphatase